MRAETSLPCWNLPTWCFHQRIWRLPVLWLSLVFQLHQAHTMLEHEVWGNPNVFPDHGHSYLFPDKLFLIPMWVRVVLLSWHIKFKANTSMSAASRASDSKSGYNWETKHKKKEARVKSVFQVPLSVWGWGSPEWMSGWSSEYMCTVDMGRTPMPHGKWQRLLVGRGSEERQSLPLLQV